jgi:hypothetical protein
MLLKSIHLSLILAGLISVNYWFSLAEVFAPYSVVSYLAARWDQDTLTDIMSQKLSINPTQTVGAKNQKSVTPTITPSPIFPQIENDSNEPQNSILIRQPAPQSEVLSPIDLQANLTISEGTGFRLELVDQQGNTLARKIYAYRPPPTEMPADLSILGNPLVMIKPAEPRPITLSTSLDFGIPQNNQTGRLQIVIFDETGRSRTLSSVDLTLLTDGKPTLLPTQTESERLMILQPASHAQVSKVLRVSGKAFVTHNLPLRVELESKDNAVVVGRMVSVLPKDGTKGAMKEEEGEFTVDLSFKVKAPSLALLTIYEPSDMIMYPRTITSREVILLP